MEKPHLGSAEMGFFVKLKLCKQSSFVFSTFCIVAQGNCDLDNKIREALFILRDRPNLNVQVNQGIEFSIKDFC